MLVIDIDPAVFVHFFTVTDNEFLKSLVIYFANVFVSGAVIVYELGKLLRVAVPLADRLGLGILPAHSDDEIRSRHGDDQEYCKPQREIFDVFWFLDRFLLGYYGFLLVIHEIPFQTAL